MLEISTIKINGLEEGCITDSRPNIGFTLASDRSGESLKKAVISCGDWVQETDNQICNRYEGDFEPYTTYTLNITACGESGDTAKRKVSFQTGRLDSPWEAKWITNGEYEVEKKQSPIPMVFRKSFTAHHEVRCAKIYATALGVYELQLNGNKVGQDYFAPGFTAYEHQIQYQVYDVTQQLQSKNALVVTVAGGWAVGSFTYHRKNKISADKQALLLELHIEYENGAHDIISSDESWEVTQNGNYQMAEWYDGETYDSTVNLAEASWKPVTITTTRKSPKLIAQYGCPVRVQQVLKPINYFKSPNGEWVYDFGQNFSGVISANISGKKGQQVVFRHAEVLVDNELFVKSLRTAKATATYICAEGEQYYSPRFTYMGFRYVGVSGIEPDNLELEAFVLHSDFEETGSFECSNQLVNRLQSCIRWGGKSNFVDIPTDCPQRDERQGWTGDIAVFAQTACYNFDMSRFFRKWLLDMQAEQRKSGGIPMVIPRAGDRWPVFASACWGDSCVLVPWAEYLARGDLSLLEWHYPVIQKFLKAAKWWASFLAFTPNRRFIWQWPFQYGDWCAPEGSVQHWIMRGKWIATPYFANSCAIAAKIADLLGKADDASYYRKLRAKIIIAFRKVFTDGKGKLKKEFQSAYVLPLYFDMTEGEERKAMANNLARLVEENGNHLATGFPGTPYLLFALSDNGHKDKAFEVLLQESCPSWLYEVKAGGTTIWERWDALRPDGTVNITELSGGKKDEDSSGGMVSFNHYAGGAVGDWLYRRIAGIEPTSGGYRTFNIAPLPGGGITSAKGAVRTPYGEVISDWRIENGVFSIQVKVPVSTECRLTLPDGQQHWLSSGGYTFSCSMPQYK